MLGAEQLSEFQTRGFTCLRGAVDVAAASQLCDQVWESLGEKAGVDRATRVLDKFQKPNAKMTNALKKAGAFDLIYCDAVRQSADQMLGCGQWDSTASGPNLLLTLPGQTEWRLPHQVWHFDYRCPGERAGLPGVQVFLCLDHVEPGGGGTLAVAGSHRLVARIQEAATRDFEGKSADVKSRLKREVPWLRELFRPGSDREARFMQRAEEHNGIALQVVEFTGGCGDVILMHPWTLHSLSANCSERARIVLTDRLRSKAHPF